MASWMSFLPQTPDIPSEVGNILRSYRTGYDTQDAMQQNLLRKQIGSTMSSEGPLAAANVAFAGGDVQTGIDLQNMPIERQAKFYDVIGRAAMAADTPEKWQRMTDAFVRTFGADSMTGFEDFSSRDQAISLSMTAAQQVEAALARRRLDIEEAKLGQPDLSLTEIYNEAGQPQKVLFDKSSGQYQPVGAPKAQSGGISFTTPDGSVIEIGGTPGGNAQLGRTVASQVQQKAINTSELASRTASIAKDFDPTFLELGTKLSNWWASGKAKIDSDLLGDDEKRGLNKFAQFQSRALGNLNRLLNELSGAAVSPQEAERLRAELPDPGSGWFDGDDPVSFRSKMERILTDANAALARYRFYQATGIPSNIEEIPLSDVKQVGDKWYVKKDGKWFGV
jgi:hypothetical protein